MAKKITSRIEEIDGKKYIVERNERGKVICRSLHDEEPTAKVEPVIDMVKLTEGEFRKVVLEKLGYKIKEG